MKTTRLLATTIAAVLTLTACNKPTDQATTPAQEAKPGDGQAATESTGVDLSAETTAYKAWVAAQIDELVIGTEKFVAALEAGDTEAAKKLYPVVRMHFERSEPIAESFGDLDPRIDNREADLEAGEKWTGFHAIEKILWTKNTTEGTAELGKQLVADVKELRAKIPTADVTGELMVQGSVDLLNEVTTTKITGEEEIFSKTDLYDFKANIEGAEKIFDILKPKLQEKDPALVTTLTDNFQAVDALLAKHQVGGGYIAYDKLTPDDTKALAEAVNKLGEPLAQMGIVLQ